jgi:phosphopantothenoylcysteine decarboxylase/phosphopantothenate--cysteine ligase
MPSTPRHAARLRVLVTAGPTREPLDPVRYLSNDSSGKMGFAIAAAAARAGHATTLIAGPVEQRTPRGVERIDVVTAREMLAACRREFARCDVLYMAAAVADWRPRRCKRGKWRKQAGSNGIALLELVENPDILRTLARRKGPRLVVGFALETGNGLERARAKLVRKGADYIVLNGPAALGGERTSATVLGRTGSVRVERDVTKAALARRLVALASEGIPLSTRDTRSLRSTRSTRGTRRAENPA